MKNTISIASLGFASCKVGELTLANSLYEKSQAEAIRNQRIIEAQQLTETVETSETQEGEATKRGEV